MKTFLINDIKSTKERNEVKYPVILKKRQGRGSKDIFIAKEYKKDKEFIGNENFIIQEYINKKNIEYTAGVYIGDESKFNLTCILKKTLKQVCCREKNN